MKTYTAYYKATIHAKNDKAFKTKADDHIKTKYRNTMKMTDFVEQEE